MARATIVGIAMALALAPGAPPASAGDFPSKAIRLIVPFPPGGPADVSARVLSDPVSALLGRAVVVEYKPGPGAISAMRELLAAPADGHTLLLASNVLATGKFLFKDAPFDPLRDVRAVIGISRSPQLVVASPSFAANDIQDLIRLAKEHPGVINCAVVLGTLPHLGAALFMQLTGTDMATIPYQGSAAILPALMGGQVDVYFDSMMSSARLVSQGRLKALGVTSSSRVAGFPQLATVAEQGVRDYELYSWFGIVAGARTPDAIVARLNNAFDNALQLPSVRERFAALGATPIGGAPEVFGNLVAADYEKWGHTIRAARITAN